VIFAFFEYLFSCNDENVRFVMSKHVDTRFAFGKFLIWVRTNKTLTRHPARKYLSFKKPIN
jgi:hypothetical protein